MLDLTSSLFLGLHHPAGDRAGWTSLTTGRAAALDEPVAARRVAARVAARLGAPAGIVHRSALHALVDVVDVLAPSAVLVDAGAYPLVRLAAGATAPVVRAFGHHDVDDVARLLAGEGAGHGRGARTGRRPVVVTDGWCAACNRPAPLAALERVVRAAGGTLVVDDTQAFGVLGPGGSGTWRWAGGRPVGAVQVVSLAKGLGAPLTVTTGPRDVVARLAVHGTRWHASPPTAADLRAADRATDPAGGPVLARRRRRLWWLVRALRAGLRRLGLAVVGRPFPVVHARVPDPARVARVLRGRGVRALVLAPACLPGPVLTFVVTAEHAPADVEHVLAALRGAVPGTGLPTVPTAVPR
ncbi:aminotransferase class I/II-fold pyridoxal phosphate-dependent enzyme [Cellulomonas sp. zg-ZUI199]|uniref:8-amino-7-oxononanoate synthase n=1 Tax=Cellulomonas wangleii TaxID=2816956 RepID=A0ABX8D8T2_9CELL|nr:MULTISPECIES: aminotransferase class I/II-fold pyridoxal phosphate-dependent enzyme [Cellulomonas]MBO0898519.1 aminotransferase class I/II-fold pyridoxal phosphate-dependent enzyme [Cellulomonas sp. zg-ZUI22]MBO0924471.1 aminotransferase class I/II-fold pyridoxal phosphate-dependent enzyme [Cellulomonas wangleii]QVI62462.1 aminotransferase class I/II-fold pyridoxal phosphate-dependent enzyme [Cellulomonas wangleii]